MVYDLFVGALFTFEANILTLQLMSGRGWLEIQRSWSLFALSLSLIKVHFYGIYELNRFWFSLIFHCNLVDQREFEVCLILYLRRSRRCGTIFTSNTSPWVFFTLLKLYKWYQIAQSITFRLRHLKWQFSGLPTGNVSYCNL